MSDTEWVYSLYIQANPVPDPERFLASRYETDLLVIEGSQDMDTQQQLTEVPATEPASLRKVAAIAFAAVVVVAGIVAGVALLAGDESGVASGAGDTPIGGQSSSTTESEIIAGFVTFDGSECTVAGATELPPGDHAFVLTDVSDRDGVELFARNLADGHTFQDALDQQEEAGGPGSNWPRPSWALGAMPDFDPPEIDLADNQQLLAVSLEPGNHYLAIWATRPSSLWLCAPFVVIEP